MKHCETTACLCETKCWRNLSSEVEGSMRSKDLWGRRICVIKGSVRSRQLHTLEGSTRIAPVSEILWPHISARCEMPRSCQNNNKFHHLHCNMATSLIKNLTLDFLSTHLSTLTLLWYWLGLVGAVLIQLSIFGHWPFDK